MTDRRFAGGLAVAAAAVGLLYLRFHAPWLDELQAWALVRASPSPAALWANIGPEAHPPLWYVLLAFVQLVSLDPAAMAVFHAALATSAIWILGRHAPFHPLVRILIACSVFVLVEYFAVARGYVLVELLTFAACAELGGRRRPWVLAILLSLLAQAEVHGAVLGGGLCAAWLLSERERAPAARLSAPVLAGSALWALSAALCLWELGRRLRLPAPPTSMFLPIPAPPEWQLGLTGTLRWLVPPVSAGLKLWTRWFPALSPLPIAAGAAIGLFVALTLSLRRSRPALACWLLSGLPLLAALHFARGEPRHVGMIFLAFVASLWIAGPALQPAPRSKAAALVTLFLAQQAISGAILFVRELGHPRSASTATARYLRAERLQDLPFVCDRDDATVSVLGLLDRGCFFPSIGADSRFVRWGPGRSRVGPGDLAAASSRLLESSPLVVLLLNHRLEAPPRGVGLRAAFEEASMGSEKFYVYEARKVP